MRILSSTFLPFLPPACRAPTGRGGGLLPEGPQAEETTAAITKDEYVAPVGADVARLEAVVEHRKTSVALAGLLEHGIELYCGRTGAKPHPFTVTDRRTVDQEGRSETIQITSGALDALRRRRATDVQLQKVALGLSLAVGELVDQGEAEFSLYRAELAEKFDAAYTRLGWDPTIHGMRDITIDGLLDFLGRAERQREKESPGEGGPLHLVGNIRHFGRLHRLQLVDERRAAQFGRWFDLALERRGRTIHVVGGRCPPHIAELFLAKDGVEASEEVRQDLSLLTLEREKRLPVAEVSEIDAPKLREWWKRLEAEEGCVFERLLLVTHLRRRGHIKTVRLLQAEHARAFGPFNYVHLALLRRQDVLVIENASGMHAQWLLESLSKQAGIELSEEVRRRYFGEIALTNPEEIGVDKIKARWRRYEANWRRTFERLHLVGIVSRFGGLRSVELVQAPPVHARGPEHFDVELQRRRGTVIVGRVSGPRVELVVEALAKQAGVKVHSRRGAQRR